ncbi:MAG TPA: PIN domain-containing protein [Pirellulales bacterium]|nr:PIN domain-containing protein [Pirellulales bacterium]
MKTVFADTSFYVAFCNLCDRHHSKAIDLAIRFQGQVVTTEFVLVELGNFLSRSDDRATFVRLFNQLRADEHTLILAASHEMFEVGYELYADRADKDWSLVDCISFAVMRERQLTDALTADHHFEQAGFAALMN